MYQSAEAVYHTGLAVAGVCEATDDGAGREDGLPRRCALLSYSSC